MLSPPKAKEPTTLRKPSPRIGTRTGRSETFSGSGAGSGACPVSAGPGAGFDAPRVLGRRHRTAATNANETALSRKAKASPDAAMRMPPIAGPMMKARLSRLAHALFAGPRRDSSPTSDGRNAPIVGPKKDEKHVARMDSATTAQRGPLNATRTARPTMIAPRARSVDRRMRRRSNRSAAIPAGTDRITYGMTRAAPTMPRSTVSPPLLS